MPNAKYPRWFNTRPCDKASTPEGCQRAYCWFYHGEEQRRCVAFAFNGACPDGDQCPFADSHVVPNPWPRYFKPSGNSPLRFAVRQSRGRSYRGRNMFFRGFGNRPRFALPKYLKRLLPMILPDELMECIAKDHEEAKAPLKISASLVRQLRAAAATSSRGPTKELLVLQMQLEQAQSLHDIRFFDLPSAKLTAPKDPKDRNGLSPKPGYAFVEIECSGLAEKRPSVLRGDGIHIGVTDDQWYEGYVHFVRQTSVIVSVPAIAVLTESTGTFHVVFSIPVTNANRMFTAIVGDRFRALTSELVDMSISRRLEQPVSHPALATLNADGQRAFADGVLNQPRRLHLLHGPPGTGKTYTLAKLLHALIGGRAAVRVLVMTPSNVSADLITSRLAANGIESGRMLRVVAATRDPKTIPADVMRFVPQHGPVTLEDVAKAEVVVCTLMTASVIFGVIPYGHVAGNFTHIFIDEMGQSTEQEVAVGLQFATDNTCVVVAGDHKQLGPMIRNHLCKSTGMARSPLERLCVDQSARNTMICRNYRSVPALVALINPTYGNRLIAHRPSHPLGGEIHFLHTESKEEQEADSPSWFNKDESAIVFALILHLLQVKKISPEDIVVLAPYQKQVEKIRGTLHFFGNPPDSVVPGLHRVKVCSVELFQGAEARVIIMSCVRSQFCDLLETDVKYNIGFLRNDKRLNVALSRAKDHLYIVGNARFLQGADAEWLRVVDAIAAGNGLKAVVAVPRNDARRTLDPTNLPAVNRSTPTAWARASPRPSVAAAHAAPDAGTAASADAAWHRPE